MISPLFSIIPIADLHSQSLDLVFVVQRGPRNSRAGENTGSK